MSYISNLVHRTLGVTPVAQPVIQARFAPLSRPVNTSGQDSGPVRTAAPALSTSQASPLAAQSRTIAVQPEAAGRPQDRAQPSRPDPAAHETQASLRPGGQPEDPRLQRPDPSAHSVKVRAQAAETPSRSQHPDGSFDEFRLMRTASGVRPSLPAYGPSHSPSFSQSRKTKGGEGPVVRVHIGRVDVRMVTPGTKEQRAAVQEVPEAKPASLDEYLRAKQRGTR